MKSKKSDQKLTDVYVSCNVPVTNSTAINNNAIHVAVEETCLLHVKLIDEPMDVCITVYCGYYFFIKV